MSPKIQVPLSRLEKKNKPIIRKGSQGVMGESRTADLIDPRTSQISSAEIVQQQTDGLFDPRLKSAQRQQMAISLGQLQGNKAFQRLVAPRGEGMGKKALQLTSLGSHPLPAGISGHWNFSHGGHGYVQTFLPPQPHRMPISRLAGFQGDNKPHGILQMHNVLMRVPIEGETAAPEGEEPEPAEEKAPDAKEGEAKNYSLALYDYNKAHMVAWPDAQATLLSQWKHYLGKAKGKGPLYDRLKKGGYLDKKYAEKVANQEKYMAYAGKKSALEAKVKKSKGKTKTKYEKELKGLKAEAAVPDVQALVVDVAKELQKEAFKGWGLQWARAVKGKAYEVTDEKSAESKLEEVITARSPAKLQMLALFGHGGSAQGWLHMGNLRKMLVKEKIKKGLATNLQVLLYMCSAGAGGEKSFAAKLAGTLKKEGLTGMEVWAHTTSGSAAYNPNWVVFKDLESGGALYNAVFSKKFIENEADRLGKKWTDQKTMLSLTKGIYHFNKVNSIEEIMRRWYGAAGANSETSSYIMYAPVREKYKESVKGLRDVWSGWIDAQLEQQGERMKKWKKWKKPKKKTSE